jgi:hypothetical protein
VGAHFAVAAGQLDDFQLLLALLLDFAGGCLFLLRLAACRAGRLVAQGSIIAGGD